MKEDTYPKGIFCLENIDNIKDFFSTKDTVCLLPKNNG
jgi:hypothetical protein